MKIETSKDTNNSIDRLIDPSHAVVDDLRLNRGGVNILVSCQPIGVAYV